MPGVVGTPMTNLGVELALRERGIEVSLCGDAAGDPLLIPQLVASGLRSLSMAPRRAGRARLAIAAASAAG